MMNMKILKNLVIVAATILLVGCGGIVSDNRNYNFDHNNVAFVDKDGNEVKREIFVNKNKTAEFFIDSTADMRSVAKDVNFQKILLDSYDSVQNAFGDVETTIYSVGENINPENTDFINNVSPGSFGGSSDNVLIKALTAEMNKSNDKVIVPKIKIIVTDLSQQLDSYQNIAKTIKDSVMENGQSFAILTINTSKPFFIFVIGAQQDLSDYIETFYNAPDVSRFAGYIDKLAIDQEYKVNCTVFAQKCGVMGIDYDNVEPKEKGDVYIAPVGAEPPVTNGQGMPAPPPMTDGQDMPAPPPMPNGQDMPAPPPMPNGQGMSAPPPMPDGQAPQETSRLVDDAGSFSILRYDYTPELMNSKIEGSVNFTYDKAAQGVSEDSPWIEIAPPDGVDANDVNVADIKYLAFKSLYWDKAEDAQQWGQVSGKIKLKIPFRAMSQIKLSTLLYDISTDVSVAYKGESSFSEANAKEKDTFSVEWSDGVTPSQGRYRINDDDNTAILKICVDDMSKLPDISKLDIKFTAYQDENIIPAWAYNKANSGYPNMDKFISLLNQYQKDYNKLEDTLTCYVCAGDEETYEEAELQTYAEYKKLFEEQHGVDEE